MVTEPGGNYACSKGGVASINRIGRWTERERNIAMKFQLIILAQRDVRSRVSCTTGIIGVSLYLNKV